MNKINGSNKRCTKCGEVGGKDGCGFHKDGRKKDGLKSQCKICRLHSGREWRKNNREKVRQVRREYCKNNREKVNQASRERRKNNPEKVRQVNRKYYKNNPEKVKQASKKRGKNNLEKLNDVYIKKRLSRQFNIISKDTTQQLIDLKREQLKKYRLAKQRRKELKQCHN